MHVIQLSSRQISQDTLSRRVGFANLIRQLKREMRSLDETLAADLREGVSIEAGIHDAYIKVRERRGKRVEKLVVR